MRARLSQSVQQCPTKIAALTGRSFTALALTISVVVNLALTRELKILLKESSDRGRPAVGSIVPPLVGTSIDGQPVILAYDGALPTILYYFSATCGWCERNWENVRALNRGTLGRFRFVGVARSSDVGGYLRDRDLSFEIVTGVGSDRTNEYRFGGTPTTLVVGPEGRILKHWVGAYSGPLGKELERYFGIILPGLTTKRLGGLP